MTTKLIVIVALSVAVVLLMVVFGKVAEGKGEKKEDAEK